MQTRNQNPSTNRMPFAPTGAMAYFGPARVLDVSDDEAQIQVMLAAPEAPAATPGAPQSVWVDRAFPADQDVAWGDTVLVAGGAGDDYYAIGVVGAPREPVREPSRSLDLESGLRAESPDGHSLTVYAADGRVLFRHEGESGQSRIDLPDGDVQFVARSGSIDFVACEKIRFTSKEEIQLASLAGVRVAVHDAMQKVTSLLEVAPRKLAVHSEEIDLEADRAEVRVDRTQVLGQRLHIAFDRVKSFVKRSEHHSETLIEKAKNAYRRVSALDQTTAGRSRTIVEGGYEVRSQSANMQSRDRFKIDGKEIHLG